MTLTHCVTIIAVPAEHDMRVSCCVYNNNNVYNAQLFVSVLVQPSLVDSPSPIN